MEIIEHIEREWNIVEQLAKCEIINLQRFIFENIEYRNFKYDNKMLDEQRHFRFFLNQIVTKNWNDERYLILTIYFNYLITKYKLSIENTNKNFTFVKNLYLLRSVPSLNKFKPYHIKYDNGLNSREIEYLIYKLNIHINVLIGERVKITDINYSNVVIQMNQLESQAKNVKLNALFQLSVQGDNNHTHCNFLFYDYNKNLWIRIEPAGVKFYDTTSTSHHYTKLDLYIETHVKNYLSHNDYYHLPGIHYINDGPYCTFYCIMLIEEYINYKNHNLFDVMEQFLNHDYVVSKLIHYSQLLNQLSS